MLSTRTSCAVPLSSRDQQPTSDIPPTRRHRRRSRSTRSQSPSTATTTATLADSPSYVHDNVASVSSITTDDVSESPSDSWDDGGEPPQSSSPLTQGLQVFGKTTRNGGSTAYQQQHMEISIAGSSTDMAFAAIALRNYEDVGMDEFSPKVEELDDTDGLDGIATAHPRSPVATAAATALPVNVPRKRGRPRKHPLPDASILFKVSKGRSKTGCITCRRRKKKCDETKPSCLNCQKNAVVCEGYPPKEIWKSGKQKMEDARSQSIVVAAVPRSLPLLIDGIETEIDRRFLDHFVYGFSRVLTLINDDSNPFKEILLPMACQHRGLMHSLMCLSGSHLSALDPEPKVRDRKYFHFHRAIRDLNDSINTTSSASEEERQLLVEDPIIASTIALSLNTICEGETHGEYRPHMDAARYLLLSQKPRNEKFHRFIVEFFQYHDVSNSITSLDRRPTLLAAELRLPDFIASAAQPAGAFLGVFDGLFNYMSEITILRDRVRKRYMEGYDPAVDYQILSEAVMIDSAIRSWETSHPAHTPNFFLAQLYRQSTWIYLYRTICPSRPSEKIARVVDDGLAWLDQLPQDAGAYSIVLMPLFLLGCSAFETRQRERIKLGFETLKAYSNLRNIEPALTVVEKVWDVMDSKIEESWDWEKIINDMNMDFLIT